MDRLLDLDLDLRWKGWEVGKYVLVHHLVVFGLSAIYDTLPAMLLPAAATPATPLHGLACVSLLVYVGYEYAFFPFGYVCECGFYLVS